MRVVTSVVVSPGLGFCLLLVRTHEWVGAMGNQQEGKGYIFFPFFSDFRLFRFRK